MPIYESMTFLPFLRDASCLANYSHDVITRNSAGTGCKTNKVSI
jgi:hypothetical protein